MNFENLQFGIEDGVARIVLNRPDKLNSFTVAMHRELRQALDAVQSDASVRVLLLTGAGRGFCAGQDLADLQQSDTPNDLGKLVRDWYAPLVLTLRSLPMPVVCAVNGVAVGAGANLALACDLVLAAQSASFVEAFCKLGLIPDTGGTYFLPRALGTARAMGLALLGDKLSAEQAEDWGLIWKCYDDADLMPQAEKLCAQLAKAPTRGLARTKQLINESGMNALPAQLSREADCMQELGASHDYNEGVAAFLEKRAPRFIGK